MLLKGKFLYGENYELRKGTLVIEDGIIKGFTNEHDKDVIEFKGLIIPPLINAHTHIADNSIKDIGINKTLDELVKPPNGLKHRYLAECNDNMLVEGMKLGLEDMKEHGIKFFCDFRENGVKGINLLKTALKSYDYPKAIILGRPTKVDKKEVEEILEISDGLGLSGANEFENDELKLIFRVFKRFKEKDDKKLFAIHAAEHEGALKYSLNKYGMTEIERLTYLGVKPDFIVHGTHLTNNDLELLKENNIPVVACVRANLSFNVGMPKLNELNENLLVGIGTDNFMANSPSIFKEMDFIYKLYHIEPKDILRMATINNAKILKLENVGLIEEGFKAIFTFIKPTNAILFSKNIVASVVTRCEKGDVVDFRLI
ncbi:amidohydrolase family protein [Methanocaldococcus fervens]|uniref:amidohydrolase family protein n=1 Tax=Methanocaldococcus fervens TaxID=83171 RepID=UPI00064FE372|nr:amidohydrolase family protein [Methanocaldococcus fervens]